MRWRRRFGGVPLGTRTHERARAAQRFVRLSLAAAWAAPLTSSFSLSALAQTTSALAIDRAHAHQSVVGVSAFVGVVILATATTLLLLTGRRRWLQRERQLLSQLGAVRTALDRAHVFLAAEPQILVAWGAASGEPDVTGDLSLIADAAGQARPLGFGSWLTPELAQSLEASVERLRCRGESFRLGLTTLGGRHVEAEGRAVGGRAVLRIRDVAGDRLELTRLRENHARALMDIQSFRALLDAVPSAAWMRDSAGKLVWVNAAYARAVEAPNADDAVARGAELLETAAREAAAQARNRGEVWRGRAPAVVAGQRHMLEITDAPSAGGALAIAVDQTELEGMRGNLARQMEAHARTLDQLSTGVAIFDGAKRLVFHNSAYRQLWSLDAAWLESKPTDSEILDRLRAERRLPEQVDFRAWKAGLMSAYQSTETTEQVWYLPDRRMLRVVFTPNSQGGVTYVFDDVTDSYKLQTQYHSLVTVQGETLDTLREGVAVFGTDGRLKLVNLAFSQLWGLEGPELKKALEAAETDRGRAPHVDEIIASCRAMCPDDSMWGDLRSIVAGLHDTRMGFERRIRRTNDTVLDCATAPLPDGSTLVTFSDVTAAANFQRALTDRNEALLIAQQLREDFVHHVSYELRSPLTNIIGFIHLLGDAAVGSLNPKQSEYAGHILESSAALLAIINDILDLATIDEDALELSLSEIDVSETMHAAAGGVQDRLAEASITLNIVALDGIGTFQADAKRVRQVLFNLLSNAIGFSSPGQTVTLAALRRGDEIVFKVSDQGRGIPSEVLDTVFERFRSHTVGARHRGVGLGLSIVRSLVELHGGRVQIESAPGEGTIVTCIFPAHSAALKAASAQ
ncbi:MAG: Multi-sensor signal transduction histidine kinase [Hyphomicrobiales bacterium]|nr:Multi-sensor signal transduction histidine kinase [Hyphomicrobiales bacterium]